MRRTLNWRRGDEAGQGQSQSHGQAQAPNFSSGSGSGQSGGSGPSSSSSSTPSSAASPSLFRNSVYDDTLSLSSRQSSAQNSVFSRSRLSASTSGTGASVTGSVYSSSTPGRLMKVMEIEEDSLPEAPALTVSQELEKLAGDLTVMLDQMRMANRTAMAVAQAIHATAQTYAVRTYVPPGDSDSDRSSSTATDSQAKPTQHSPVVSMQTTPALGRIVKVALHFIDNLLLQDAGEGPRHQVMRSLEELGVALGLVDPPGPGATVKYPANYAIGQVGTTLSSYQLLTSILNHIVNSPDEAIHLSEQEGAFIAPVLRGLSESFSVLALSFGFPEPCRDHYDAVSSMHDMAADVHVYCQRNYIRTAAGPIVSSVAPSSVSTSTNAFPSIRPPFRIPNNANEPPMAMSLATENASSISGTLGGYIYPKLSPDSEHYSTFGRATFAVTCAHVCLNESPDDDLPRVCVPSPVLIAYFKRALAHERDKYPARSGEWAEYQRAVSELEERFQPPSSGQQDSTLGQIVWGERKVVDGAISDLAIIKCEDRYKCRNYLGTDVAFSEYDPALMFGNLHVKRVVRKMVPGMAVFKYGSTSKYTTGRLNGPRIIYWADGRIQTSEFVIQSGFSGLFATGGDSGAWLLQKSDDDAPSVSDHTVGRQRSSSLLQADNASTSTAAGTSGPSLGVVGMLHSYDGERKEFGLFTPIDTILERLHTVTSIQWGVVGVPDDSLDVIPAGGSDTDGSDHSDGY